MTRNGFTLLEIVIVIALITILSAVILPNFVNSTAKAKLESDISSAKIIQNAIDIYNAEQQTSMSTSYTVDQMITELYNTKYIKQSTYKPQIAGAKFTYNATNNTINLDITDKSVDAKVLTAYNNLTANEQQFVVSK